VWDWPWEDCVPFGKRGDEEKDPAVMSRELRDKALSVTAADLSLAPTQTRLDVWGVLMELGYPQATATLAVFADGTSSLYISTGGGVIGSGEHKPVREESEKFLFAAQCFIEHFEPAGETPYPKPGRVRFYIRTFETTLAAEADEQELGRNLHELGPLFHAGHAVITQMRLISERRDEA
jgi:hypothetical protein